MRSPHTPATSKTLRQSLHTHTQTSSTTHPSTMAPFTVSTRGVVLGGKAENSLHSDLQELGRDDVKGALRVDAATNVKDTDLVFTTTDHTVRTVRLCGVFNGGGGHGPRASPTDERERRRGRRKKKKATARREVTRRAARRAGTPLALLCRGRRVREGRIAPLGACLGLLIGQRGEGASREPRASRQRRHRSTSVVTRPPRPARACATRRAAAGSKTRPCASLPARARPVFTSCARARRCRSFSRRKKESC